MQEPATGDERQLPPAAGGDTSIRTACPSLS
jgi:hypothetical protein